MKKYLILSLIFIITVSYLYYVYPLTMDAIWCYGFGNNIVDGMIPYNDYNMVIPPLFPFITAIFIFILGKKLIVYYILISILITAITYISYKKIGYKTILIYLIIMIYPHNGYNVFVLFLFILLLENIDNNNKLIAFLISLMILTKQTIALLIIPSVIYSKNKKQTIIVYLISFLLLLLYLIINNNLYNFINYCFLGLIDFGKSNFTNINYLLIIEILLCTYLLFILIKSKFKDQKIFYILLFQIISFPIVDISHIIITIIPIIIYLYDKYNNFLFNIIFTASLIPFAISYNISIYKNNYNVIYNNKESFMNGKLIANNIESYVKEIKEYQETYKGYKLYLLEFKSYLYKLETKQKINKYDLINNGNLGYKGNEEYISEIEEDCLKNKCLIIINEKELNGDINQTDKKILKYVNKNYEKIPLFHSNNNLIIYISKKK